MKRELILLFLSLALSFAEYRSYNGTGNNVDNTGWGSVDIEFLRGNGSVSYEDYLIYESDGSTPNTTGRLGAREVSNIVVNNDDPPSDTELSLLHMFWGQFLDHDITLTTTNSSDEWDIDVPAGDDYFSSLSTLPFPRSNAYRSSGTRQQYNSNTAFIDGSTIYSSDEDFLNTYLRDNGTCYLKVNSTAEFGDLLPTQASIGLYGHMANDGNYFGQVANGTLYLSGDVRANENPVLTALHTVFVREHNRLCGEFASITDDDTRFETARKWVIAFLQQITFNEYSTATLGAPLGSYPGYDSSVNPTIDNFFCTVGFRYGHTEIQTYIPIYSPSSGDYDSEIKIRDYFFNPTYVSENGIEGLLSGIPRVSQNKVDPFYEEDIRNYLFGGTNNSAWVGQDLASRNIQRGRDHGTPKYNDMREHFGLDRVTSFSDITSDTDVQARLESAYASVDDIDPYIAGLAEDPNGISSLGPLFTASVRDQYTRLRNGDRFYFENTDNGPGFTSDEITTIKETKLIDIVLRNTDISKLSCSLMFTSSDLLCGDPSIAPPASLTNLLSDLYVNISVTATSGSDLIHFNVTLFQMYSDQWISVGFPDFNATTDTSPRMLGSDVVIGYNYGSDYGVGDYHIGNTRDQECPDGVCVDTEIGGTDNLISRTFTISDGKINMLFSRYRNTLDTIGDHVLVNECDTQYLIVASGEIIDGAPTLNYHGTYKTTAGVSYVLGTNCDSTSTPTPTESSSSPAAVLGFSAVFYVFVVCFCFFI